MDQQPALQLGLLLRRAHRRAALAAEEALAPEGISGRHLGVLMVLSARGPMSQQQLVTALDSDRASMVRTVDHLVSLGHVTREPVPDDRRQNAVTLTASGRAARERVVRVANHTAEELLAHLEPAERQTLITLLRKFVTT